MVRFSVQMLSKSLAQLEAASMKPLLLVVPLTVALLVCLSPPLPCP